MRKFTRAVFALVSASTILVTKSRRAKPIQEITDDLMPALFQIQAGETYIQGKPGIPPRRILGVDLEIYVSNSAIPTAAPERSSTRSWTPLRRPWGRITPASRRLGGLVYRCWIEGRIEVFEGILEGKVVALVPIQIEIP